MKKLNLLQRILVKRELLGIVTESDLVCKQLKNEISENNARRFLKLVKRYNKFIKKYNLINIEDFERVSDNKEETYELFIRVGVVNRAIAVMGMLVAGSMLK